MRRPSSVNKNLSRARSFWGIAQGGLPSCGGSRRFCGVGGTRPPRLSPLGKRERGSKDSRSLLPQAVIRVRFVHHRRFALLPFALFVEQLAPVPVGALNIVFGCCHLRFELALSEKNFVLRCWRSHPDSAICEKTKSLKPLFSFRPFERCCCGAVHRPPQSPTVDAAVPPVSVIPPQSHASWHSFLRVPPT